MQKHMFDNVSACFLASLSFHICDDLTSVLARS